MNRSIPDETIEEIRSRCDIVDLINSYLPLKKAGSSFKACCPFHQEKTPSFIVNPQRQSFHCFGCGKGGDSFRFIMEREGVDFPNAIHILAQRYNVVIPERTGYSNSNPMAAKARADERERIYAINEELCKFYQSYLKNNPHSPVAEYLHSRNLSAEIVENFLLGAAPDSWHDSQNFGRQKGFNDEELLSAGITVENQKDPTKQYDRFRNRLVFPIWNEQGKVVGFSARTIESDVQGAKYINTPETPVFKKSRILYALPLARQGIKQHSSAILCEGQLDVIAMHRAGYDNSVAPQGTAFTDEQARILKRYTDTLYLAFDADSAGVKAMLRAIEICLPIGFDIRIIEIPKGNDPDTVYKSGGESAIQELVNNAIDFFSFIINQLFIYFDFNTPSGKNRIVAEVIKYISFIESQVTRAAYASELANRLRLPEEAIFAELNKFQKKKYSNTRTTKSKTQAQQTQQKVETTNGMVLNVKIVKAEETLLEMALIHGTVGKRLEEELSHEMISNTPVGKALETVIQYTINDDWEYAAKALFEEINESPSPDPNLSKILTKECKLTEKQQEKAVSDCIKVIKEHYFHAEINDLMNKMKATVDPEIKSELLDKYQQFRKDLLAISKQAVIRQ